MFVSKVLFLASMAALLSACTGEIVPTSADTPEAAHAITLTETTQRVVRYNCKNQVESDGIEVVGSPTDMIAIHPSYDGWTSSNVMGSSFMNETSGDTPDLVFENVNFYISYRSGLYMRVYAGINKINYDFKFINGHMESGSRYIKVSFLQQFKEGTYEYHPSVESCQNPKP